MAGNQGFASIKARDPELLREMCSRGGKEAHRRGTAHTWTMEEAQAAGSIGGKISRRGKAKGG